MILRRGWVVEVWRLAKIEVKSVAVRMETRLGRGNVKRELFEGS
jgi:hypothetical protein